MSHLKVHFLCALYGPGEWLRVDSNDTDGKPTFRRRANQSWLSKICIHLGEIAAWSWKSLMTFMQKSTFLEKRPLMGKFSQMFSKRIHHLSDPRLSSNFVKFGWLEIGKVVHYLPDKKKLGWGSRSRFCADRAQNLPGPAPDNILRVSQISSKSAHFWRSYSQTRERRWKCFQCFQYSVKLQLLCRVVSDAVKKHFTIAKQLQLLQSNMCHEYHDSCNEDDFCHNSHNKLHNVCKCNQPNFQKTFHTKFQ